MNSIETERKFLVISDEWRSLGTGTRYRQGYLCSGSKRTVRVRTYENSGLLTIKGPTVGLSRTEYEYEIPFAEAEKMLNDLCEQPLIEKTRYRIMLNNKQWEVDEFHGANEGLIVAELELASEDETFERPVWIGREVSHDSRYFNVNLITRPFSTWDKSREKL